MLSNAQLSFSLVGGSAALARSSLRWRVASWQAFQRHRCRHGTGLQTFDPTTLPYSKCLTKSIQRSTAKLSTQGEHLSSLLWFSFCDPCAIQIERRMSRIGSDPPDDLKATIWRAPLLLQLDTCSDDIATGEPCVHGRLLCACIGFAAWEVNLLTRSSDANLASVFIRAMNHVDTWNPRDLIYVSPFRIPCRRTRRPSRSDAWTAPSCW